MNSNFNSKSNSSIQEIQIDVQEIDQQEQSLLSNNTFNDCSNIDINDFYIKKDTFNRLKKKTFGNFINNLSSEF